MEISQRTLIVVAMVLLVAVFAAGFFAGRAFLPGNAETTGPDTPFPPEQIPAPGPPEISPAPDCPYRGLVLEKSALIRRDDGTMIEGTITNPEKQNVTAVSADFALYNANRTLLGTASTYTDMFPANGTWDFVAVVMDADVDSYNLTSLCGY